MPRIRGPAGWLEVDDGGSDAPAVLFVHSVAGNAAQWRAQLEHLRGRGRRALAIDLRGHGRSEAPADGDYSMERMAADVAAVIDALDLGAAVLVGHSMGSAVALACAAAHPLSVVGVLLADSVGDWRRAPREEVSALIEALESDAYERVIEEYWQTILTGAEPGAAARVLRDLRETPKQAVVGAFHGLNTFDPIAALDAYHGPVAAIITPLNETPVSLQVLRPTLRHRLVTGTGHWLQMDRPAEFNAMLDEFLAGLGEAKPASGARR